MSRYIIIAGVIAILAAAGIAVVTQTVAYSGNGATLARQPRLDASGMDARASKKLPAEQYPMQ